MPLVKLEQVTTTFIDDVLTTGDNADALFELFPDSATSAKKISFAGIITSAEYGATLGESSDNKHQFSDKWYYYFSYIVHFK